MLFFMDYENGVIVKIYKSLVDTIIVGGACAAPKLRWTFPRDLVINDPPTHLRDNTEEGAHTQKCDISKYQISYSI